MRLRLLERIRYAFKGMTALDYNNSEAQTDSLVKHLVLILNTHQGSSASAPDYGIPDFASLANQSDLDYLRELAKILTEVISKYEPRLRNVSVAHNPAGRKTTGVLEFSLSGLVEINDERRGIFFSTAINPDGRVDVTK